MTRRLTTPLLLAALGGACGAARPSLAQSPPPATAPSAPAVALLAQQEWNELLAAVQDRKLPPAQREEAGLRLLRRPGQAAAAHGVLRKLLHSADDREGIFVAAWVLGRDPNADAALIDDLTPLLGADRTLNEAVSAAIAVFKGQERAFRTLEQFALDRGAPAAARAPVVRAMGQFVEPYAARALVDLVADSDQPAALREAAGDALIELTGQSDFGYSAQSWRGWLAANAGKSTERWKADLLPARSGRFDAQQEQYREFRRETETLLRQQFQDAAPEQKSQTALRFLRSPSADVRSIGAGIVARLVDTGGRVTPEMQDRLVEMAGDSSPRVRLAVADALRGLNYERATDALLLQLSQETDHDVRLALIGALGRVNDVRQVPLILQLLDQNASLRTRTQAASALAMRAPQIAADPILREQAAKKLWELLLASGGDDPTAREAYATVLIALRSSQNATLAPRLLSDASPVSRALGVRLLGSVADPRAVEMIRDRLQDEQEDLEVRRQALRALGQAAGPEEAAVFYRFLVGARQVRPELREAAWLGLQLLMARMSAQQLNRAAYELSADPAKRVVVLEMLAEKLKQAGPASADDWAAQKESAAAEYVKIQDWRTAAERYREALDYYLSSGRKVDDPTIEKLVSRQLAALLKSKQYGQAARLASETIKGSATQSPVMEVGALISNEASLLNRDNQLQDAQSLIAAAVAMQPPLPKSYRDSLDAVRSEVARKLQERTP